MESAFCTGCGTSVAERSGLGAPDSERRTVTVLVADLVGFTTAAHALDPEDLRRTQGEFFDRAHAVVTASGGTVEKYVGDAVVAVFGAPVAHENDPYRGVRAGLDLQRALADLALSDGTPVLARIGVATGEALVTLDVGGARDEAHVTGDVTGLATALQAAAPPGAVLVGPLTHRATAATIGYADQAAVVVPGRSTPVESWRATTVHARADDLVDPLPLVGREPEVAMVTGALQRALQERRCQLVTLVGDPGIGKSRLVRALKEFVDSPAMPTLVRWRSGHCLPYGEGVTFWALGQVVKAQAGILETDSATTARLRLETSVQGLLGRGADPEAVAALTGPLATLLSLPGGESDPVESHAAWRRYLVLLAEDAPTVVVLEDLHWADEALVGFVADLVEAASGVPLLVVTTARPELLERRPTWTSGVADALTLTLGPLTERDTALVLTRLLGPAVLPTALRQRLVDRVGGNPLYAEEYVRMLADTGALHPDATADHLSELPLPDSVQGVVDSRLDLLTSDERTVVSAAAVVGEVFWEGAVVAIAEADRAEVQRCLAHLVDREVVRRAPTTSVEGEPEYAFRHVLVRDAAYSRIPRAVRLEHHRRCADWLDRLTARRGDDVAELQAHHRTAVHELAGSLGVDDQPYAAQARQALTVAAERALRLQSVPAAHALAQRAVTLWQGEDDDPEHWRAVLFAEEVLFLHGEQAFHDSGGPARIEQAAQVLLRLGAVAEAARAETLLGRIEWFRAEEAAARRHVSRALELLADQPDSEQKAGALAELARIDMLAHRLDSAQEAAARARDLGRHLDLPEIEANALITLGCARYLTGDLQGLTDQETALRFCREHRLRATVRAINNLAASLQEEGQLRRSYALLGENDGQGAGFGLSLTSGDKLADRALQAFYDGDWRLTLELAHEALDGAEGAAHWELHLVVLRAWLLALQGSPVPDDLDAALRTVRHDSGFPQLVRPVLAHAAACRALEGRDEEAVELLDELVEHWESHGIGGGAREWLPAAVAVAITASRTDDGARLKLLVARLEAAPRETLWVRATLATTRAALALADGQPAEALEQSLLAVDTYDRIGDASSRALAALLTSRVARVAGAPDIERAMADSAEEFARRNGAVRVLRWLGRATP